MDHFLDLNGEWDFCFDTANNGIDERWYANKPEEVQTLSVPHTWEGKFKKYQGCIAFYFKEFELPTSETAKRSMIHFDGVFYHATVWLNGKLLGDNIGGYNPFDLDVSKAIKPGKKNLLCVRASTSDYNRRIAERNIKDLPMGKPFYQAPFAGIWRDVRYYSGGKTCITNLNMTGDADALKSTLEIQFINPRNYHAKFHILVTNTTGECGLISKEVRLDRENSLLKLQLTFKELEWWTPEKPQLYKVEVHLEKANSLEKHFAFRKTDIFKGEFWLNDKVYKIHGVNYSQTWLTSGGQPESLENFQKDLKAIQDAGFNVVRTGGAPFSPEALDYCDEIGLMVLQEMPIYRQRSSKDGLELVKDIVKALIQRDKSHPCIIAWGLGSENGTLMLENGTKLLKFVGEIDESRPVISNLNSVLLSDDDGYKADTGKVLGVTNDKILLYNSHRIQPRLQIDSKLSAFMPQYGVKGSHTDDLDSTALGGIDFLEGYGRMVKSLTGRILVSSSNPSLLPNVEKLQKSYGSRGKNLTGYKNLNTYRKETSKFFATDLPKKIWKTSEAFTEEANKLSSRAILDRVNLFQSSPQVSGFFLDHWNDWSVEFSGLNDQDRENKADEEIFQRINRKTRLIVSGLKKTPRSGEKLLFRVTLLNGARVSNCSVTLRLRDAKKKSLRFTKLKVSAVGSTYDMGIQSITVPKKAGTVYLEAELEKNGKVLDTMLEEIRVLAPVKLSYNKVVLLDNTSDEEKVLQAISAKGKTIVLSSLKGRSTRLVKKILESVSNGNKLCLIGLDAESLKILAKSATSAMKPAVSKTSGAMRGTWHFPVSSVWFKGCVHGKLFDRFWADVLPLHSIVPLPKSEVGAACIQLGKDSSWQLDADIQTVKYGKGKILLHQFRLLDKAEENPLAAKLLMNALGQI